MTALDQAFIRAYQQRGAAPTPAPLDFARPVPLCDALADPPDAEEPAAGQDDASPKDRADAVILAMENKPVTVAATAAGDHLAEGCGTAPQSDRPNTAEVDAGPSAGVRSQTTDEQTGTSIEGWATFGLVSPTVLRVVSADAEPDAESDPQRSPETDAAAAAVDDRFHKSGVAATAPGDRPFRPLLQVDSFAWPKVCDNLSRTAGDELDKLSAEVMAGWSQGRKVVAIGSAHRGEGCTSVLLSIAMRLGRHGLNVVLVDADLKNPQLARQLGLLPEAGWEEILFQRLPAAEVLVESVEDRIVLLPLCGTPGTPGGTVLDETTLSAGLALDLLRQHYDLVLIDLGALDEAGCAAASCTAVGKWIDAAVVVRDVRTGSPHRLDQARDCLQAAGITHTGVVENFVAQ